MFRMTLSISAVHLGAIGLELLLFPLQFGVGAVPADASPQLVALLRLLGGPFLGIAAFNWMSRKAGPSPMRRVVLIANLIGFGIVAVNDIWGVATGEARAIARYFLVAHLIFAFGFAIALARLRDVANVK